MPYDRKPAVRELPKQRILRGMVSVRFLNVFLSRLCVPMILYVVRGDDCGGGGDIGSRLLAVLHKLHD
jgi:hypothetical protein